MNAYEQTREALEMAREALKSAEKYVYGKKPNGGSLTWNDVWPSEWHHAIEAIDSALALPRRNCDRYEGYDDAYESYGETHNRPHDAAFHAAMCEWLLAHSETCGEP